MKKQIIESLPNKKYVSITEAMQTVFTDKDWIDAHMYATRSDINDGEIGMLHNIRYFVLDSKGNVIQ